MNIQVKDRSLRIEVRRPPAFTDIQIGDSIAVNGTCLTVENLTDDRLVFSIGLETIKVLNLNIDDADGEHFSLREHPVNLERSLRYGDRIHGHFVTGHVDQLARIVETYAEGGCRILKLEMPVSRLIWKKGCITVHGVSLTVNAANSVNGNLQIELCLIPETLARTNLSQFVAGDSLNIEIDWMAKGLFESRPENPWAEGSP